VDVSDTTTAKSISNAVLDLSWREQVFARYPLISNGWIELKGRPAIPNGGSFVPSSTMFVSKECITMDLARQVALVEGEDANKGVNKELFIYPATDELPNDGLLTFQTVETVYDLKGVPDRAAIAIRTEQVAMISLVAANNNVFGVTLRVLTGVPGAEYTIDFESAVYALEKVAYAPLVSELSLAADIAAQLRASERTVNDLEREKFVRSTGLPKEHRSFDQHSRELDDGVAEQ